MDRRGEGSGHDRAGLVALGLIMELVGSVVAAYLIVKTLEPVLNRAFGATWYRAAWQPSGIGRMELSSVPPWHVTLLAGIGALRAILHRRAGSAILYRRGAAGAVASYVAAALGHTALCILVFAIDQDRASLDWMAIAIVSLAWPLALLATIRSPHLRWSLGEGHAATRASAPEQVATLMIFLGVVGALVALFTLYSAIDGFGSWSHLSSILPVVVTALLCARSLVHARVGFRLAGHDPGSGDPLAVSRYVKIGLVSAALAWGWILTLQGGLLRAPPNPYSGHAYAELVPLALAVYLLFLWPLLLRRLARARGAAAELPAPAAPPRSAALPALGWLLLAAGTVQVGFALVSLALAGGRIGSPWTGQLGLSVGGLESSRGPWSQLLLAAPQLWVAIELLRGSARRRRAATLYGLCGSVATVLSIQADMHHLMRLIAGGLAGATVLVAYLLVAFSLLVPVATLVFVQHHLRREGAAAPAASIAGGE